MKQYIERLWNGLVKENPVLVLMLGMCPALAVSTQAANGIGMGLSTLAVLVLSNFVISWVAVIGICLKRLAKEERGKAALRCFAQVVPAVGIVVAMEFAAFEKKISLIQGWPADVCHILAGLACLWMGLAATRVWKKAYPLHSAAGLIK